MAQINPTIVDIAGNTRLVLDAIARACRAGGGPPDVILFPEMCLLGYPHRDLILRAGVVESCELAVDSIAAESAATAGNDTTIIIGGPRRAVGGRKPFHNSAFVIRGGRTLATYDKQIFPGYDVFDEDRYFEPGEGSVFFNVGDQRCAVLICEDIWQARDVAGSETVRPNVQRDPVREVGKDCGTLFVLSASPFVIGKGTRHVAQLEQMAADHSMNIVLVNEVGANDDLIFDGRSIAVDSGGRVLAQCRAFEYDLLDQELGSTDALRDRDDIAWQQETFGALVLGIRDYVRKTRQQRVILGLSGGIDSALTAALACAAIGAEHVTGVMMPSQYSSEGSITDAEALARNLGIDDLRTVSIEEAHDAMRSTFGLEHNDSASQTPLPGGEGLSGVADENVQARLRCVILMAISNAMPGSIVLATGNKSELAMGYCTLYGDMAGALAPLGDLYKTQVYDLSKWINEHHRACGFASAPIPEPSITKPPSAELRPDQTDQDTLPPYDVLDAVVARYVDEEQSAAAIIRETGFDAQFVQRIARTIDMNEYKRRQAAIVLKVNPRTFGPGRPMPVAMGC